VLCFFHFYFHAFFCAYVNTWYDIMIIILYETAGYSISEVWGRWGGVVEDWKKLSSIMETLVVSADLYGIAGYW